MRPRSARPANTKDISLRPAAIANALKEIHYDGVVVIESFTPDVKVIARAASIWRQIEPTCEEIASKGVRFFREPLGES
jgi:D-psicose/D-tagatose/L-ribulose 3-epimerase